MDAERERRALDAFDAVAELQARDRDADLARRLADDPALIETVRALLAAEDDRDLLPTMPPMPGAGAGDGPGAGRAEIPLPERVGAYRLERLIGRGGMGAVYLGERIDGGFEQTVAIKLIGGGLFTAAGAEQFAQERRILARLHHPHIVQLHDGGVTAAGLSYIVMERVEGAPLLEHIEAHDGRDWALGLNARLTLFLQVCQAIDYAHGQGVVHADIKPSNVIVDPRHGAKLLDFGIAGMIGAGVGASSSPRGLTPDYASPQQARGEAPTPADDIHALGVLLAALADGEAGVDAELAAVIAKARAGEPGDRYATAGALAADVERWRGRWPVAALPARRPRTALFFWRRHRMAVSLAGLAAAALTGAAVVMTLLYLQAEAARRQSDQRFAEVRSLSRYMLSDVTDALEQFPGTAPLRNTLAHRGRSYLEGLGRIPNAPADVRLEIAEGYAKTGAILAKLGSKNGGDPRAGLADLARAEAGLRAILARDPGNGEAALALSQVLVKRAGLAVTAENRPAAAAPRLAEGCALAATVERQGGRHLDAARLAHAQCLQAQVNSLDFQGLYDRSRAAADTALAEYRRLPPVADATLAALGEGQLWNMRGNADYYTSRTAASLADYQAGAAVLERAAAASPDVRVLDLLAFTDYNIASVLSDLGRHDEELAWADRGVASADQVRAFEDSPHVWRTVNIVHLERASALAALHRYDAAIAEARSNIALRKVIAARSPNDNLSQRAVPVGLRPLGDIYQLAGRRREACATYAEAMGLWDGLVRDHGALGSDTAGEIKIAKADLAKCRG